MADSPEASAEIDVESLLSGIESPGAEREMTGGEPPAAAAPEAAPVAPTWDGKAWEFEWNGKKIAPESQDRAKTWMSQGYNYSQRMGELNKTEAQRKAEWDQKQKAFQEVEAKLSPYAKVDEYAQKNPQWWAKVQQDYAAAQQAAQGITPDFAQVLKPFQEELGQVKSFIQQQQELKAAEEVKQQDQALDLEIEATRKEFPTIDFDAPDPETGKPLIDRILKHASEKGLGSFKTGVWDYLGPKLIEQAKAAGLESAAKDAAVKAKSGILGKTLAPVKELKPVDTKRPWNDPQYGAENILKEMGYA